MTGPRTPVAVAGLTLVVSRIIRHDAAPLFDMWTQPAHLVRWLGPANVTCIAADVDLRVGGRYRIGNRFPDGRIVWIEGVFEAIDAPRLLIYSWQMAPDFSPHDRAQDEAVLANERVTVRFETVDTGTRVSVLHERIPEEATRASHSAGWEGCLDGLLRYAEAIVRR